MKLSTINNAYKTEIDDKIFAKAIKEMTDIQDERIEILFTEIPTKELFKWMIANDISIENLKEYYEKYIKPRGLKNQQLEDFFEI
ncbi:hypothetical protein [Sulfurihydrogenibium azorense]|jgi:hypothetical protein|uniref:Uncharacterized protein n=1 Tax=Sulfurihydrogenibium azorense (strain DSM 15241 / OCM 825 / Az-Fu1) TaxID=204536 RepID=C1DV56_SULAA|nr:hypothetical protein [Sulfurihydrogenibium azorense]ACN98934.1 hypothetical protein SULAZ_1020 [Sulfurihydrogenibium azorense Az-Fu1]MDM7273187.1 hypothetical protein [Sulfurihydrogenibium azorense]